MVQQDTATKNSSKTSTKTTKKGNDEHAIESEVTQKRSTRKTSSVNEHNTAPQASTRAKNSTSDSTAKKRKRDDSSPEPDRSVKRAKHVTAMEIDETAQEAIPNKETTQTRANNSKVEETPRSTNKESVSSSNDFPLPNKYKVLSDVYKYVDTVFMYFKGKKNSILFEELQRQVEQMTRKPVSLMNLRQIQAVTPQLLNLEATTRGGVSVTVPLDATQLSPTQRRNKLHHALLEHVTRLHSVSNLPFMVVVTYTGTGLAEKDVHSQTSTWIH